jgi:hypothetical protein
VPTPADPTANGSTTATNATDAIEASTFQALFTRSTTQRDINTIVDLTQLLEGQNSVLNQIVYDIINGRYGKPYQNSLADSLSQSLSASMAEQARLFNLLEEYVNQDQLQASDSILPPSRLPMDLRAEEKADQGHKRGLPEIDASEWEITYMETCPHEGKRSCNPSKTTQRTAITTPARTSKKAKKKERKRLRLIQEAQQPISKPKDLPPRLCYNCRQPGHFANKCPNPRQQKPQQQKQNPGSAINNNKPSPQVEQSQLNFVGNTSIPESSFTSPCNSESRDEIPLKGGRL